ncbi:nitrite reductase small subunit [Prauserella marina]|uniref:Nitrite reductase (NADH) small subunit n=1 Tax=Prauserella marina TaxID=530584 RepID=A0A222VKA5_9PSEU|nr:nitrite reductase small subunit NirD [Prauserella marina]ASR34348.1 nitrite reductase small subunit [Prauserella marina]PWV71862.1 nitrite reductase (NADH) small subunit [Prauserella marina]SDD89531.1 nitrite reductase (NADH) small subunit [Prauserella marina]
MTTVREWTVVCPVERVPRDCGVAALLPGDVQVAIFRTGDEYHALSNVDPFSGAAVLSRGILGDSAGEPFVASPVYKQRFGLRDGRCLDDPAVRVTTFGVDVTDGMVRVSPP